MPVLHEIRNLRELWPAHAYRRAGNAPPWPTNPYARLAWLATSNADVWMPTAEEAEEERRRQDAEARARFLAGAGTRSGQ